MRSVKSIQHDLRRLAPRVAAALFLIPALLWIFTGYVLHRQDAAFQAATASEQLEGMEATASRLAMLEAFRTSPPSSVCIKSGEAALDRFRAGYCASWSRQWQFSWALWTAKAAILAGMLLLAASAACAIAASRKKSGRAAVIVTLWRCLIGASIALVLLQGAMLAWLAYWITSQPALASMLAVGACLAAVYVAFALVRPVPAAAAQQGELITTEDAPLLWERMRLLAQDTGAPPPRHIALGAGSGLWISAGEYNINGYNMRGPVLFASLPLLRILDTEETDSLLAHELAHLRDEERNAVHATLARFDRYLGAVACVKHGASIGMLLQLYRLMLELALRESTREAELVADLVAARRTSLTVATRALIKLIGHTAYARRGAMTDDGLRAFARSSDLIRAIAGAHIPHPHDTHPSLAERVSSLGTSVKGGEVPGMMMTRGPNDWLTSIPGLDHIESRIGRKDEALTPA